MILLERISYLGLVFNSLLGNPLFIGKHKKLIDELSKITVPSQNDLSRLASLKKYQKDMEGEYENLRIAIKDKKILKLLSEIYNLPSAIKASYHRVILTEADVAEITKRIFNDATPLDCTLVSVVPAYEFPLLDFNIKVQKGTGMLIINPLVTVVKNQLDFLGLMHRIQNNELPWLQLSENNE